MRYSWRAGGTTPGRLISARHGSWPRTRQIKRGTSPCTMSLGEMPFAGFVSWLQARPLRRRHGPGRKRCRWRSRAMTRSPISRSGSRRAGCRTSSTSGMSAATASRAREHRELFKADPVRYAPQFPNFCAMSLTPRRDRRGRPRELARSATASSTCSASRSGRPCSSRTSPDNTAKANQNRGARREASNAHLPDGAAPGAFMRPALRNPSRRCSRSAGFRNLPPKASGSKVGSVRRITAATRAASSSRSCWA